MSGVATLPLAIALAVVLGTVLGAALHARARAATMSDWAVGDRRFGTLLLWFLSAGEIYTTFAVLGIAGFAWAYGAPAYLAFTSVSLSAVIGYWLMPRIRAAGLRDGLVTQADFYTQHYGSRALGVVVGLAGIAALIVYVQIQITALALVVRLTLGAEIGSLAAAIIAASLMLAFVYSAGLRSAAFAAGVKDVLMIVVVAVLAAGVASRVGASSMLDVFRLAEAQHPGIGRFPGLQPAAGLSSIWLMTSALNVALGTWVFPHLFQLAYSARSTDAIRRNALWQPLYSLSYFYIVLLGFGALLAQTSPADADPNGVLLQFVQARFPAWTTGLLAGAVCLLALVPGSILLLAAASIVCRNVVLPLRPGLDERAQLRVARGAIVVFAALAVWLTVAGNRSLVQIGLSAYAAIGMLAPGVFLAFLWPRASAAGVFAGIVAGYALLVTPAAGTALAAALPECDRGLVAMGANALVAVAVSALLPRRPSGTRAQPSTAASAP